MGALDTEPKKIFSIFLTLLLISVAQTDAIVDIVGWFGSFLPVLQFLFFFIIIIMFLYAIFRAPLDVLQKGMMSLLVLSVAETDPAAAWAKYIEGVAGTFWALLGMIFIFLFPLLLILILYRSFLLLTKRW